MADQQLTAEAVEEAYVWGLPILAMHRYTVSMGTQVDGINQVFHNRALFEPGVLPGGANRDTLYSFGWFDLDDEPYVVCLPDFAGRFFVWQMTDLYGHNFFNVGNYLLEGPIDDYGSGYTFVLAGRGWDGEAPEGMDVVRAPVRMVNVLYRIQVLADSDDIAAANQFQDATVTMPLSAWESGTREPVRVLPSSPTPPYRDVVAFGQGVTGRDQRNQQFFGALAEVIGFDTPYTTWDQAAVDGPLAALGVVPGEPFDVDGLDAATRTMILDAQERAYDRVMAYSQGGFGPDVNGWQFGPPIHGNWGDDFARRAYGIVIGGMWPVPTNSTYAFAFVDPDGETLTGADATTYRLVFDADNLPPATNFWSVTVYESGTYDLYPNEHALYMVGSNNPETIYGTDGSLRIVFSHASPNDAEANWLPIPTGPFWVGIRFYAPTPEVLAVADETPGLTKTA